MSTFQMPGAVAAATDDIFLEFILPGLHIQYVKNTKVYDRFKTDTKKVVGKKVTFKCLTKGAASARPSSSSSFPTPRQGSYDEFTLYMKRAMYAQLQFDGLAIACGKGEGAIMDILKAEVKGQEIYISNKLNRQMWGDGSGRLALVYGAVSNSTTVYVDGFNHGVSTSDYTNPAQYLAEGQLVDFYDSSGNLEAEEIEISTIVDNEDGTATLTMAEAITVSDNGYIFDHDTYASSQGAGTGVPMGLMGIINASDPYTGITSTDFQGVDRATNVWARAQSMNMGVSATVITNAKLLKLIQKCEQYGRIKVILTNDRIWNAMYELWESDKTMPNDPVYWGGTTGIHFYGGRTGKIPIIWDVDAPDEKVFVIDDDHIKVYAPPSMKSGMTYIPGDSGILSRVSGKDEWVASLVWYNNIGCEKPQAQGVLNYVKHAAS